MKTATLKDPGRSTIIVADHDDESRDHLASVLTCAGYDVLARASFDRLIGGRPDGARCCLVMDYRLQGRNGLDLWAQFTAQQAELPVVFLSAQANVAVAVRAIKAGAVDFLAKPICEEALLDAVQAALEQDVVRQARQKAFRQVETSYGSLSPREREVMWHVTSGLMNKQVAGLMGLSEITVKVHRGNVMRKMNARTFADLITKANALPEKPSMPGHDLTLTSLASIVPPNRRVSVNFARTYA